MSKKLDLAQGPLGQDGLVKDLCHLFNCDILADLSIFGCTAKRHGDKSRSERIKKKRLEIIGSKIGRGRTMRNKQGCKECRT